MSSWQSITAIVVPGHQVASGGNGNPRFPGGTLRMQEPFFKELGLDLGRFHRGTLNVSIAPLRYITLRAPRTFREVKWHPVEPAEDFSFFDVRLVRPDGAKVDGLIYHPHPETKPEHFQSPDVLELLFPHMDGIEYGSRILLEVPDDQMTFAGPPEPATTFQPSTTNQP